LEGALCPYPFRVHKMQAARWRSGPNVKLGTRIKPKVSVDHPRKTKAGPRVEAACYAAALVHGILGGGRVGKEQNKMRSNDWCKVVGYRHLGNNVQSS